VIYYYYNSVNMSRPVRYHYHYDSTSMSRSRTRVYK